MTTFVNHLTETLLASSSYESLSTTVGAVAVLLLLALLLVKEVVRVSMHRADRTMRVIDAGIAPLIPTAGIIIVARLAQLL